jgi:hypothetical protein
MHIFGEGAETDRTAIGLYTKKKRWIKNCQRKGAAKARMDAAKAIWLGRFPDIKIRSLTSEYNCFGMVFANRRTWIVDGDEVEKKVFPDDGYRKLTDPNEICIGDVAVYRKGPGAPIEHVALVMEVTIDQGRVETLLLSQWGEDGEYIHRVNAVPTAFGAFVEYFSERTK